MNWLPPKSRLDAHQTNVLNRCMMRPHGADWIRGFAGSGKTVLLVYIVREFRIANPGKSVCGVVFTHALKDLVGTDGIPDDVPVMTYPAFNSNKRHYDLIVVDEVQDLPKKVLRTLKKYAGKIVVACDFDQSIYDRCVSQEDIEQILEPNAHELGKVFRLTDRIRKLACTILPDSKIRDATINKGANTQVSLAKASSRSEEIDWLVRVSSDYTTAGEPVAILMSRHRQILGLCRGICDRTGAAAPGHSIPRKEFYAQFNERMAEVGQPFRYLGSDIGRLAESDSEELVYLMTYHSAKGLDFETVLLPMLEAGTRPFNGDEKLDRRLFFVALTRCRLDLFLSHSSTLPHQYVQNMPSSELTSISCEKPKSGTIPGGSFF